MWLERGRRAIVAVVLTTMGSVALQPATPAVAATQGIDAASVQSMLAGVVNAYAEKSNSSDVTYFDGTEWHNGQEAMCWRCTLGPAVAAAALAKANGDTVKLNQAVASFDRTIAAHQLPNGTYYPVNIGEGGPDLTTMFAATEFGAAYVLLYDQLSNSQRQRWGASIVAAADFLIANGNLSWYTNGNIVVGNALVMYYAYVASGQERHRLAYEKALTFAVSPPQNRWPGYGLIYTVTPTRADGSDGAAYFTEAGAGGNGYDAEYTSVQFDQLIRLYLVSNDARVLRLSNMLANQLLPRIDLNTGWLNTSNGTRHTETSRWVGALMPGYGVLANQGGRSDFVSVANALWPKQDVNFRTSVNFVNFGMYYNLGAQPVSLLMSALATDGGAGLAPPPSSSTPTPTPVSAASTSKAGYVMSTANGGVYAFGDAQYAGNIASGNVVDVESTATGKGYWLLEANGRLSSFGDAKAAGDMVGYLNPGETAVSVSADPLSGGYWIFTSLGRTRALGGAKNVGDMTGRRLNSPVLDSVATPSGNGYYMVAADGGVFSFGDAAFSGSMGGKPLNKPVRSLVPDGDGQGYWLVASDGGVFAFDASFRGSMGGARLNRDITGMVRFGNGYLMVGADGGIFNFSDKPFLGSLGTNPPSSPVVAVAAVN